MQRRTVLQVSLLVATLVVAGAAWVYLVRGPSADEPVVDDGVVCAEGSQCFESPAALQGSPANPAETENIVIDATGIHLAPQP